MNFFIKILTISLLAFFIIGCNEDDKKDQEIKKPFINKQHIKEETPQEKETQREVEIYDDDEEEYKDGHDENSYKDNGNSISIVDSASAPRVDLYSGPSGAYSKYEHDSSKGNVVALYSNGIKNSFHILGYDATEKYQWNEYPSYQNRFNVSWDGKFSEDFIVFIVLKFKTGSGEVKYRDLVYTPSPKGYSNYTGDFLHVYLGSSAKDGNWHHFSRNILSDLRTFYPGATINYDDNMAGYVNGFAIRGSGKITNVTLSK